MTGHARASHIFAPKRPLTCHRVCRRCGRPPRQGGSHRRAYAPADYALSRKVLTVQVMTSQNGRFWSCRRSGLALDSPIPEDCPGPPPSCSPSACTRMMTVPPGAGTRWARDPGIVQSPGDRRCCGRQPLREHSRHGRDGRRLGSVRSAAPRAGLARMRPALLGRSCRRCPSTGPAPAGSGTGGTSGAGQPDAIRRPWVGTVPLLRDRDRPGGTLPRSRPSKRHDSTPWLQGRRCCSGLPAGDIGLHGRGRAVGGASGQCREVWSGAADVLSWLRR
jgi:hypothetical protein